MTNADLLCFSHLRWSAAFQRTNHLMSRFAKHHRTFFIEEPKMLAKGGTPHIDVTVHRDGLRLCIPWVPPELSGPQRERVQRSLLLKLLRDHEIYPRILWFDNPMAIGLVEGIDAPLVVYDCADHVAAVRDGFGRSDEHERQMLARADVVFAGGDSLYRAKRSKHHAVHSFPNGIDAKHFAHVRAVQTEPVDQRELPRPLVGFVGLIDERVDVELVTHIADTRPDWHVVMLGPVLRGEPAALPHRANLHWLGCKPYEDLPAYIAGWSVAMMPFRCNASTELMGAGNILEYLACGRPVVATAISDIVHPFGDRRLVRIAEPGGFVAAIASAMVDDRATSVATLDLIDATTSWDDIFERITDRMCEALFNDRRGMAITRRDVGSRR